MGRLFSRASQARKKIAPSDVARRSPPFSSVAETLLVAVADEIDAAVFEGHGGGMIHPWAYDLDRAVHLPPSSSGALAPVDDDHDFAGGTVRSPEPVVVVTADGGGQAMAEDVDGARLSVVRAGDGDLALIFRGE